MDEKSTGFLLNVQRGDHYRVSACQSFRKTLSEDGRTLILLYDSDDIAGRDPVGMISLEPGDACYVMDAKFGTTVNTIRAVPRVAQLRSTA